jgi:methylmalonyl-CoA mutase
MEQKKLFRDFPPATTQEWKDKITKDLKGAEYEKKLFWKTEEGFSVPPFYREEDVANLPNKNSRPGDFPFVRGNNPKGNKWLVNQIISVDDIPEANAKALDIRMKGVDSISFVFEEGQQPSEAETENLLMNIRADLMELNFKSDSPEKMVQHIDRLVKKYNRNLDKVHGSVFCDPLSFYSINGHFKNSKETDFSQLEKSLKAAEHLPNFHTLTVDGSIFHNAGSGIVSEMAFALSMAVDYLNYLREQRFDIDYIAQHIRFNFSVGSQYFMEIAKFRALRYLWAKIVNAYGINNADSAKMYIHGSSSRWNKTIYDPYVNMLRTTTETMSAGIAGIDSMTVLPFDAVYENTSDFSERVARNQQLILQEESYFDKVADPAAGSYYIENLTEKLISEAWKLFLEVDDRGGYLKSFEEGFIVQKVKEEAQQKDMAIATRKKSVLGTNQYPNTNEKAEKLFPPSYIGETEKNLLKPYRAAEAFEQLRFKTEKFSRQNKRPAVWMFTFGNLAMQKARSQFAANFFGCAGFQIVNNPGFTSIAKGIAAAKKESPEIVVVCSSDKEYVDNALEIFHALKNDTIVVLAGYPNDLIEHMKSEGLENFIHIKTNVLEELNRYQQLLNIG